MQIRYNIDVDLNCGEENRVAEGRDTDKQVHYTKDFSYREDINLPRK